jgi:TatD DNase family protein
VFLSKCEIKEVNSITDTHAHLDYTDYDSDRDAVVERAETVDVSKIITIGIGRDSIPRSLKLCEKYPGVFAAVGVHPMALNALRLDEWNLLETASVHARVVAIGETGLDYHRLPKENVDQEKNFQHDYFFRQLDLARRVDKPVVIHCRDAYDDTLKILQEFGRFRSEPGVMHCFGGDRAMADRVFELGYFISVGGILTFKNAPALRELVAGMPRDLLLLETDCPYLAPVPHRGKRNEPAFTRFVAEKVAELWKISLEETASIVEANVKRLFGI